MPVTKPSWMQWKGSKTRPIIRENWASDRLAAAELAVRSAFRARRGEHPEYAQGNFVDVPNLQGTKLGGTLKGASFNPTSNSHVGLPPNTTP